MNHLILQSSPSLNRFSLLGPNILLNAPFIKNPQALALFKVRDQI